MPMDFKIYAPSEYTFTKYFLPKIKNPILEYFEVDTRHFGIQRKGNNHLVVFLEYCLKKHMSRLTEENDGEAEFFFVKKTEDRELFKRVFAHEKEVSLFRVSYNPKMSAIAWKLLMDIADDPRILVRDEEDRLITGPECVKELSSFLL